MKRNKHLNPDAPLRHEGHKRPISRRDFLGQGFLTGAAMVASPSMFGMFKSNDAYAQAVNCGFAAGGAGLIPFICFDLAGGANISGSNVLVGGPGGQQDFITEEGYSKLGLPSDLTPEKPGQINNEFGLLFHSDSAFLAGMLSKTSVTTRANCNGTIICARSDNDTENNPHNPMYGINKAGADGDLVTLIGTRASDSGGKSVYPMSMFDPTARPTKISSGSDATGLVDTGKLVSLLNQADAGAVMSTAEKITEFKVNKLTEDQMIKDLIYCNYAETTDLVARYGNPSLLDPELDPDITGATGIFSTQEMTSSRFRKTAAVMKLCIEGYAGAGCIENGGYDYHDSTRATGEVRDFLAGQMFGATLEFAARRGQQLMLYIFSDGSVASDGTLDNSNEGRGKGIWKGDNSSTAASVILVYDPAGRPALSRADANQIGYFRPSGSVETAANAVASNVTGLCESVVLNYMALHNDVGRFAQVLPTHGLGNAAQMDSLIAFAPIR